MSKHPHKLYLSPDHQFLLLFLVLTLLGIAWRLDTPRTQPAPDETPKAADREASWSLIAPAQASEETPAARFSFREIGRAVPPVQEPGVYVQALPEREEISESSSLPASTELPPWQAKAGLDYAVQLGVYASWQNALKAARELRGRSLRPELVLDDGQRPVLRLVVGHFPDREAALAAARVYQRQRLTEAWIYRREDAALSASWAR